MHPFATFLIVWLCSATACGRDFASVVRAPRLGVRQEVVISDVGEVTYDCLPSCEIGGGTNNKRLVRRSAKAASIIPSHDHWINSNNDTVVENLTKRQWKLAANDGLINAQQPYSIENVNEYVFRQVYDGRGTYDSQYQAFRGLVTGVDESAVSDHDLFGDTNFQIGTNGIHGCQVVTVVSPRGVWMAHFWESYTNGKPNTDDVGTKTRPARSLKAFDERMIYFLTGVDAGDPGVYNREFPYSGLVGQPPTTNHPFITPTGESLKANAAYMSTANDGAGIQVFIATPYRPLERNGKKAQLMYERRVKRVSSALQAYLGSAIKIVVYPYHRLDTDKDETATAQDPRGLYLFQYDTNADGNGKRQWRLFYENAYYFGDVA